MKNVQEKERRFRHRQILKGGREGGKKKRAILARGGKGRKRFVKGKKNPFQRGKKGGGGEEKYFSQKKNGMVTGKGKEKGIPIFPSKEGKGGEKSLSFGRRAKGEVCL